MFDNNRPALTKTKVVVRFLWLTISHILSLATASVGAELMKTGQLQVEIGRKMIDVIIVDAMMMMVTSRRRQ